MICTALGQHCHTHETSLTLIRVLTWQASLSERQLQDTKSQIHFNRITGIYWVYFSYYGQSLQLVFLFTNQLVEEFFWWHVKSHCVNDLQGNTYVRFVIWAHEREWHRHRIGQRFSTGGSQDCFEWVTKCAVKETTTTHVILCFSDARVPEKNTLSWFNIIC